MVRRGLRLLDQLSWRDRWILAQALVLLPLTAAALRALSFARLQSLLSSTLPSPLDATSSASSPDRIRATTRLVRIAAHHGLLRVTCLPHSIVLWWLLRRQRANAVLRLGVRKTGGELEAHAWVEHDGVALNDHTDVHERYAAFDRAIVQ